MNIIYTIVSELPGFAKGILVSFEVFSGLLTLGIIVGLIIAILEVFAKPYVRFIVSLIRRIIWAIPQILLLFVIYYLPFDLSPKITAIIALGLSSATFQSQIFRGAFQAVKTGQLEAGQAMGLGKLKTIWFIVIPQMTRYVIGPWTNEFVIQVKATSIAYVVGVGEIIRQAKYIIAYSHGNTLIVYFFVAMIYFIICKTGNFFFCFLSNKIWVPGFERR